LSTLERKFDKSRLVVDPAHVRPAEDESVLIAAAKNGNAQALGVLIARHQRMILAVALRCSRVRQDAEDIVQQTFQKAFLRLHQFEGRSSFSTWLTRVAINEARMLYRKNGWRREVSIDDSNENAETATLLQIPDLTPDPEAGYSQREWGRILSSAMDELPNKTRRAIQLRELDEHSTEETAQIMGISINAVKGRVFHGRKKLRERLKHHVGSVWTLRRDTSREIGSTGHISQDQAARNFCA
jgi:RNA polymerase sigma-70 factor (ECF subfamily)